MEAFGHFMIEKRSFTSNLTSHAKGTMCGSYTTLFMVHYPILKCILGYIDNSQLHLKWQLMTLGVSLCLLISWCEYV